jgi:peptidoglycan/xylan/chitin deacetylase (PgdA/CDA1 family)
MTANAIRAPVYLTYDDGPYPTTSEVLDVLRDEEVKATFFLCAIHLERNASLQYGILKRMLTERGGHSVGNHGYDHNPASKRGYLATTPAAVEEDFTTNVARFERLFFVRGDKFPGFKVGRLPGDGRTLKGYRDMVTTKLKLPHVGWDLEFAPNGVAGWVAFRDWQGVAGVSATRKGLPAANDIILMHDRHWAGRKRELAALIRKLKETVRIAPLLPLAAGHRSVQYP